MFAKMVRRHQIRSVFCFWGSIHEWFR